MATHASEQPMKTRHVGESHWLLYGRLVGLPTVVCMGIVAVVQQLVREFAGETTHWAAVGVLFTVCLLLSVALLSGNPKTARRRMLLAGISMAVLLTSSWALELSENHQSLYLIVFGVSLWTCWSAWISHANQMQHDDNAALPKPTDKVQGVSAAKADRIIAGDNVEVPIQGLTDSELASSCDTTDETLGSEDGLPASEKRPIWARYAWVILLGIVFVVYMIIVPTISLLIDWWTPEKGFRELEEMTLSESLRLHAVSGVVMLMFLAAGASVGSFLNVVIYRLPRGLPIFWPPSACPNCEARILGNDNVPILSWFRLGGRCRACGVSISMRYPVIEAVCAAVFVLFYYRELLSGGANLPVRQPNFYHGVVWILFYTKWNLVSIYLFHMFLLASLLAWGMINYDRFRVSWWLWLSTLAFTICSVGLFPVLNPLAANWQPRLVGISPGWTLSLFGCVVGAVLGAAVELLTMLRPQHSRSCQDEASNSELSLSPESEADPSGNESAHPVQLHGAYGTASSKPCVRSNAAASLCLVGSQLGAEAAVVTFALAVPLSVVGNRVLSWLANWRARQVRVVPFTLSVFFVSVVYLVFWRQVHGFGTSLLAGISSHL